MTATPPVRIFIGSGEASLLERKTMIHSLRKRTCRALDIYVINGTHNALERNDEAPVLAPMPLWIKYRNFTEFSNYRWLIPQICGFAGRAIYVDSDMLCLADIGELFDQPLEGCDFLAKAEAYAHSGVGHWGLSVMLMDCARCRFDPETYFREIDAGLYTSRDLHEMTPRFLERHPFRIGELDPNWNVFDRCDGQTRLIHYTNLLTQPWKERGHPSGAIWFREFFEAHASGLITDDDIECSRMRSYVRQDILSGNGRRLPRPWPGVRRLVSRALRRRAA